MAKARDQPRSSGGSFVDQFIPPYNYTNVISNERAMEYVNGERLKPIEELQKSMDDTEAERLKMGVNKGVVFWYKTDLRINDNRGLSQAFKAARDAKVPLICVFLVPIDMWKRNGISNVRLDFVMRHATTLCDDLRKLNITFLMRLSHNEAEDILEFASQNECGHIYANIEYEVDELRREAKLIKSALKKNIAVNLSHDTCVVNPTELLTKSTNKPFTIFSHYYNSWVTYLRENPDSLIASEKLEVMPLERVKIIDEDMKIDIKNLSSFWPVSETEANRMLDEWVKSKEFKAYKDNRDMMTENTSGLSVYIAVGCIPARAAVRKALVGTNLKSIIDKNRSSAATWISEIAWRDFYRNILVNFPYVCMNKPFKLKTESIKWSDNKEHYLKWINGKTGYPIVDASMRQLAKTGYLHNRGRMIVASFLTKHLLINWQWGEYFFMKHLIDGDFASNNGGWGFSSSCGVDAQPYFRIFNPTRQSERFDPNGDYIRKWVPELKDFSASAIHNPYANNAAQARKAGYPCPIVNHAEARQLALQVFKQNR